ncbi:DNA-directed RNA polymerase III subunit RPC4 [Quillaja saponaria]|uniref:DNA-directed RNA polymerase III subunit RPC4 n=1 Tax=Quillaja saponaria TaxID=32244 RepID=A0AAD7VNF8_QUISA|nr:DNA-directed RNA polymerase III subunit RPC4 [Quillaja saponaria]
MDQGRSSSTPRKLKFAPKAPNRKKPKRPTPTKTQEVEKDDAEDLALLRSFNEKFAVQESKVETKLQVAFGTGTTSPTSLRTYGVAKDSSKSSSSLPIDYDDGQKIISLPSNANAIGEGSDMSFADVPGAASPKVKEGYTEPWDYNSYYPTTLPLRMPYSGDPELLDEVEFGEAAGNMEYNENAINPAKDLGLLEKGEEKKMFLFKLPALPLVKQSMSVNGKEKVGTSTSLGGSGGAKKRCTLEQLPGGHMGKMLVYKSGAIKLKIGETLYDVSPGIDVKCPQDIVAINTAERNCCVLGQLGKRAVVTPDVDHALDSMMDLS